MKNRARFFAPTLAIILAGLMFFSGSGSVDLRAQSQKLKIGDKLAVIPVPARWSGRNLAGGKYLLQKGRYRGYRQYIEISVQDASAQSEEELVKKLLTSAEKNRYRVKIMPTKTIKWQQHSDSQQGQFYYMLVRLQRDARGGGVKNFWRLVGIRRLYDKAPKWVSFIWRADRTHNLDKQYKPGLEILKTIRFLDKPPVTKKAEPPPKKAKRITGNYPPGPAEEKYFE